MDRVQMRAPEAPGPIEELIDRALREDLGGLDLAGDLTTRAIDVDPNTRVGARLVAKAEGTLSGLTVFAAVFDRLADLSGTPRAAIAFHKGDGDRVLPSDLVASIHGAAPLVLAAERTALNFLQRLSGTATLTRRFVAATTGTSARVLDTRKTTPGWRALEKAAVVHGGGANHRIGLYDQVLLKENHFAVAGRGLGEGVSYVRARVGPDVFVVAEVRTPDEALEVARAGVDVVMLDNFDPETAAVVLERLRREAASFPRRVTTEVSGGIRLENAAAWARTGVDRISVGALTHSAGALDLSLLIDTGRGGEA